MSLSSRCLRRPFMVHELLPLPRSTERQHELRVQLLGVLDRVDSDERKPFDLRCRPGGGASAGRASKRSFPNADSTLTTPTSEPTEPPAVQPELMRCRSQPYRARQEGERTFTHPRAHEVSQGVLDRDHARCASSPMSCAGLSARRCTSSGHAEPPQRQKPAGVGAAPEADD